MACEKDSPLRGVSSKRNTKKGSPITVQPDITPPDSSSSTSKPNLRNTLQELQVMLGPQTLRLCELCEGLSDLTKTSEAESLQDVMRAIYKVKKACSEVNIACEKIENELFKICGNPDK